MDGGASMTNPDYVIARLRQRHGTYSWQGQALQYDQFGPPGEIVYRRFFGDQGLPVDTLLAYDDEGDLAGVFNFYPQGGPMDIDGTVLEQPGNANSFIRPDLEEREPGKLYEQLRAEAHRRGWPVAEDNKTQFVTADGTPAGEYRPGQPSPNGGIDGNRRISRLRKMTS
jgi:hypothetical protein